MNWEATKFGDILKRVERFEKRNPSSVYQFSGTYSFGKGIFLSKNLKGTEFALEYVQRIKQDDFIYCKIMAWEGGFGVVQKESDNTVMSGAFVAYEIDKEKVLPEYLNYYFKVEKVWKSIGGKSTGTNLRRRSLHPDDFEANSLPLPSLPIQKVIIKKLELVKSKLSLIEKLKAEQQRDFRVLQNSVFNELIEQAPKAPIGKVLIEVGEPCEIKHSQFYKQVTVRTEHKGISLRKLIKGNEIGSVQTKVKSGNFIISKIDARNGAMGFIPDELEGAVVTNDFPIFDFSEEVNPKFFGYFSNTIYFDRACKKASEGSTNRVRLKMDKFYNIEMPLPNKEKQDEVVAMLDKTHEIKKHQYLTSPQLKAVFPSVLDKAFKGKW
jgi:type I restriction enzyme S subunit